MDKERQEFQLGNTAYISEVHLENMFVSEVK